ncbi:hypothetical protein BOTNAR_0052g00340 [Botryotinia narcissicola]|uniref:Peptidase M20 dimerisation domain-containing protein n=1 Tax=Botryotinia narcissicola TaxID=278944 RepID=A0A4Z1IZU6_9HELO|nr:hypothetical protein BOTNAR_0052g00340 [Botryotinia narcissicola]
MEKRYIIQQYCPELASFEEIYRDIHRNPELSLQEIRTAAIVVEFLESLGGYRAIKGIGIHGVVEILENGSGATVPLRADMDALRHLENTNLDDGKETPVMHACGHDASVINFSEA